MVNTTAGTRQRPDNPRRMLYPAHAIVRLPGAGNQRKYTCLCGERGDVQSLGKHIMKYTVG